jgi:septal ring factor EnvC (AmiA/AmiB activator)
MRRMRGLALALATLLFVATVGAQPADDAARADKERETRQQLERVRAEIRALTEQQRATQDERSDAIDALRDQDLAINAVAREIEQLDAAATHQQQELDGLERQRQELATTLAAQRAALAALLRSAYALGRNEELKLLLQQDDVAAIARVLAYHRYFQRARVDRIDGLLADLADLARIEDTIRTRTTELDATRARHAGERERLEAERAARAQLVAGIEARLAEQRARIAALGKDEAALKGLLEELRDVFADIPRTLAGDVSFASQKGRLQWPLDGPLLGKFGQVDRTGRKNAGWLIGAETGSRVHAIARGRVAFADWFRGYGMLLILDHGDGWFSLYGCNEALLKDVGDWVNAGEIIANSGASGVHGTPALYFELRRRSDAVNPAGWLRSAGK